VPHLWYLWVTPKEPAGNAVSAGEAEWQAGVVFFCAFTDDSRLTVGQAGIVSMA
jgi:hypothetical protein